MDISGDRTPNRSVTVVEPRPQFVVLSGQVVEETAPAQELTRRVVLAWLEGLRNLNNPALAPMYEETPRSRVGSEDGPERYQKILDLAEELKIAPADQTEFIKLFLPSAAPSVFLDTLLRMGVELVFTDDLVRVDESVLEYKNPVQPVLVGQQETSSRKINPDAVAALLEEISYPSLAETTYHLPDDYRENNAIDADSKAHERLFRQFGQYVERLLLLK